jgi:cytoplasmic iron level regulating protein YaaA (DUF328/UPF0246 family)
MATPESARAKLLGVKGVALAAATEADRAVMTSPTRPAIERYTGVLYDALHAASLPAVPRRRLGRQVRILSGLWGIVAPDDPIPDYKLKMGASLAGVGKLSTGWRPLVTAALASEVRGRTVWSLLPNEHAAAWAPDLSGRSSPASVLSVRFLDEVRRGRRRELITVSHWNKLLKGALVRHILTVQLTDIDGLADFDHPLGYRFEPDLTEVAADGVRVTASLVKRT